MSLVIREKKVLDDWEDLLREYLKEARGIKDKERLESVVSQLRTNLKEKKRHVFCAYLDGALCGFISGSHQGEVLEVVSLYVLESSYDLNCGFELVKALTEKAFSLDFKHFRFQRKLPFTKEPTFEENLKKEGYLIFPRNEMFLEVKDVLDYSFTLPSGYSFEPFTIEKVDEIMQVVVDSNPIEHPDSHIHPEMRSVEVTKRVFGGFTENFTKLDLTLNPQIMFEGKIIGISLVFSFQKDVAYIGEMCVHPDHQRKGLGKALMMNILQECSRKGIKRMGLAVTTSNTGAYQLYVRNGFKITDNLLVIIKHK